MTNSEISAVLDQIIVALQEVHHKQPETYTIFYDKLALILSNVPKNLLFTDVTDKDLRAKIAKVWNYFFAKNQHHLKYTTTSPNTKLGTLDLNARAILIAHRFYIDFTFTDNKTILFKLLDTLNISLVAPTCIALNELGVLKQILYTRLILNMNIFELLEFQIEQKVALKEATSLIKLKEIRRFAEEILTACNDLGITHGFKEKTFEEVAARCAALNPTRPYSLKFLSKRHTWDIADVTLDNINFEGEKLSNPQENKRNKRQKLLI